MYKIIIECDGDYWHANPLFYDINKLGIRQKRNTQRDRFKNEYLKRKGWKVLRFFESDIKKSPSKCIAIVEDQIKKVANPFDSL
jgi:very-short-patch-repair endonuclease